MEPVYNFAQDLIGRNLAVRASKIAFIDDHGSYSYGQVAERAARCGNGLLSLGLRPGDRAILCMVDSIDFIAAFLGCALAGIVPVPTNPLFKAEDYAYILGDSEATMAIVSHSAAEEFQAAIRLIEWRGQILQSGGPAPAHLDLARVIAQASPDLQPFASTAEDVAFWLYSSGSTGEPKGTPHRHGSPILTAQLFAQDVFGLQKDDRIFSAAKLFFAYGLGNGLTFPMSVGATTVLLAGRATPEVVGDLLVREKITVFCGVPTLYASLLAYPGFPSPDRLSLRRCMSAGEGLPKPIGEAWTARTGTEIVDGIGSTEMLHIYVSNRPGDIAYGTTGRPVPGYEIRLIDEVGQEATAGALGELYVRGPSMTTGYWRRADKNRATFIDGWMKTGDKFTRDSEGRYIHCGRADDMLKVGGIWVSPSEVETALMSHEAVLEAAVIGAPDADGLVKPMAFVVLKTGHPPKAELVVELQAHTKDRLAPYKYPRTIAFVDELPKTATGKIRRYLLREANLPRAKGQTP